MLDTFYDVLLRNKDWAQDASMHADQDKEERCIAARAVLTLSKNAKSEREGEEALPSR